MRETNFINKQELKFKKKRRQNSENKHTNLELIVDVDDTAEIKVGGREWRDVQLHPRPYVILTWIDNATLHFSYFALFLLGVPLSIVGDDLKQENLR